MDCNGIDFATDQFTKILNDTCLRSLRLACPQKKTKKHRKWFDKDCACLRKKLRVLSNKKHRYPQDDNVRHDYHRVRKEFKKLVKHKKAKLLNSQVEDLIQNKDRHKFWIYLESLKEKEPFHSNKHDVPA